MKGCQDCAHGHEGMQGYCKDSLANKCSPGWKLWEARGKEYPAAEVRTPLDFNNVDHPKHYTDVVPGIECIQVTEHFDFLLGNAIKYIWRSGRKGENTALQDLKKAEWYIKRAIAREEGR